MGYSEQKMKEKGFYAVNTKKDKNAMNSSNHIINS
jgi:hypothetical protein